MSISLEWDATFAAGKIQPGGHAHLYWLFDTFANEYQERVLELGCGVGDNAAYWVSRQADYYGIDGSAAAVEIFLKRCPFLKHNVAVCDFTEERHFNGPFDVIFDRAALSHNEHDGMARALGYAFDVLKPGGIYIGCDWFSILHSEWLRGKKTDCKYTKTDYPDGQFEGIGKAHFATYEELGELFEKFEPVMLQERIIRRPSLAGKFAPRTIFRWISRDFDGKDYLSAVWDVIARKPK